MDKNTESIDRNTEQNKKLYREQYYANHGEYPKESEEGSGCLGDLIKLPFVLLFYIIKGLFYLFPKFLWEKGSVGKKLLVGYIGIWIVAICVFFAVQQQNVRIKIEKQKQEVESALPALTGATELNLRSGPSSNDKIITVIPKNTIIKVLEMNEGEEWVKVLYNNNRGYVNKNYITIDKSVESAFPALTGAAELNLRSGPSSNDEIITVIPKNTMIKVLEMNEGEEWVKVLHNNNRGYVNKNYITIDKSIEE